MKNNENCQKVPKIYKSILHFVLNSPYCPMIKHDKIAETEKKYEEGRSDEQLQRENEKRKKTTVAICFVSLRTVYAV